MADYSKQPAYPPQPEAQQFAAQQQQGGGYPPQQSAGAYPPQQAPPQQAGAYPPQQAPPQQAGAYPPQQPGAYPPQQAPPPYYPQQGPPPPQQQQQQVTTTVIQSQPTYIAPVSFGDYPVTITDSQGRQVQTILEYRAGSTTHLIACVICFIGWFVFLPILFFFWVPYLINSTKDVYHISPTDGSVVGVYRRR